MCAFLPSFLFTSIFSLLFPGPRTQSQILDDGYPFITGNNALTSAIPVPTLANKLMNVVLSKSAVSGGVGRGLLTNMPWRRANVKYIQNEIYFDIIEELNVAIDQRGKPVVTDVNGMIECNSQLSGVPDVSVDFRNSHALGDCAWHPCVRVRAWQRDRCASFVPPDGKFLLCTYRLRDVSTVSLPFYVSSEVSYSQHSGSVNIRVGPRPGTNLCKARSLQGKPPAIEKLCVVIQFPSFVRSFDPQPSFGKARYDEQAKVCRWEIGTLVPERDNTELRGRIAIHEVKGAGGAAADVGGAESKSGRGSPAPGTPAAALSPRVGGRPDPATRHYNSIPLKLEFRIPKTTVSGLSIANMRVKDMSRNPKKKEYQANKACRLQTRAGVYELRL